MPPTWRRPALPRPAADRHRHADARRGHRSALHGALSVGKTVTLTLTFSEAVKVASGTPTLTLNDGGTASYVSGSGTSALVFSTTIAAGQTATALAPTAVNLNGATITDAAGNEASLTLTGVITGPQIDTTTPKVTAIAELPPPARLTPARRSS